MNKNILFRFMLALGLAVLLGAGFITPSKAGQQSKPASAPAIAQFRSIGRNDGTVREYADDYWTGSVTNSTSSTMFVGDDMARRLVYGILDFDTSALPDTAMIDSATLEVRVINYNTYFGDPYMVLGDMYADITYPYFGAKVGLEPWDFESPYYSYAGAFYPVFGSNQWSLMDVDPGALGGISLNDHTQFRLFFFDDNDDSYSQGLTLASGNHPRFAFRPVLTVYFTMP